MVPALAARSVTKRSLLAAAAERFRGEARGKSCGGFFLFVGLGRRTCQAAPSLEIVSSRHKTVIYGLSYICSRRVRTSGISTARDRVGLSRPCGRLCSSCVCRDDANVVKRKRWKERPWKWRYDRQRSRWNRVSQIYCLYCEIILEKLLSIFIFYLIINISFMTCHILYT